MKPVTHPTYICHDIAALEARLTPKPYPSLMIYDTTPPTAAEERARLRRISRKLRAAKRVLDATSAQSHFPS